MVGMGEIKTASQPGEVLMALGLGSCIGVCVYDLAKRLYVMAHVVLPSSTGFSVDVPGKYGDTALPAILDTLQSRGSVGRGLKAFMVGGAQLFSFGAATPKLDIGERNASVIESELRSRNIPIVAKDVGGNSGRTVNLNVETGRVMVKTIGRGEALLAELHRAAA